MIKKKKKKKKAPLKIGFEPVRSYYISISFVIS
jgi:hypothetical protein